MTKIALVTGASSGIGDATVRRLLRDGWSVYAAARRIDRMQPLETLGALIIPLDLTCDNSIVVAVREIERQAGGVDLLINNAGYGSYGALEDVPFEEARRQFEVNLFGLARLCQLVLPAMRARHAGRIVNISSIGGKFGEPFGSWYHAAKYAVEGLSDCLRLELAPFGIKVIVVEPGAISTEWGGIAHQSLIERSGRSAYAPWALRHAAMLEGAAKFAASPDVVGDAIARISRAKNPKPRYAVGGGAKFFLLLRWLLSDRMFDRLIWKFSQSAR